MFKNTIIVILAAVILSFGIVMKSAKSEEQPEGSYPDLSGLEEKVDLLLKMSKEKDFAQISGKLDQVLSNQNKIISELEIVKVRASHR